MPLKVLIEVQDGAESLTGETVIVNLHGALISTSIELNAGMEISVYVYLTDKRARAQVVHVDPENPMRCGIELEKPQNILGKSSNATETIKVEILIYYQKVSQGLRNLARPSLPTCHSYHLLLS